MLLQIHNGCNYLIQRQTKGQVETETRKPTKKQFIQGTLLWIGLIQPEKMQPHLLSFRTVRKKFKAFLGSSICIDVDHLLQESRGIRKEADCQIAGLFSDHSLKI